MNRDKGRGQSGGESEISKRILDDPEIEIQVQRIRENPLKYPPASEQERNSDFLMHREIFSVQKHFSF